MNMIVDITGHKVSRYGGLGALAAHFERLKTHTGHDYSLCRNGLCVYSTADNPFLKKYLAVGSEDWDGLKKSDGQPFDHEKKNTPSVYFDIDGTLGYWYVGNRGYVYPEEVLDPANHYFLTIEKHPFMIALAEKLQNEGLDVCVISAAGHETIRDKWEWLHKHLPFIKDENICFSPLGADKSGFVKGNAEISILIDDYPENLNVWKGTSVKAINSVNSHQDRFPEINGIEAETNPQHWDSVMDESKALIKRLVIENSRFEDVIKTQSRSVQRRLACMRGQKPYGFAI